MSIDYFEILKRFPVKSPRRQYVEMFKIDATRFEDLKQLAEIYKVDSAFVCECLEEPEVFDIDGKLLLIKLKESMDKNLKDILLDVPQHLSERYNKTEYNSFIKNDSSLAFLGRSFPESVPKFLLHLITKVKLKFSLTDEQANKTIHFYFNKLLTRKDFRMALLETTDKVTINDYTHTYEEVINSFININKNKLKTSESRVFPEKITLYQMSYLSYLLKKSTIHLRVDINQLAKWEAQKLISSLVDGTPLPEELKSLLDERQKLD
ncbi:hypothetical protein BBD42_21595 [Paenibacillus sp. BIHB 4019]|uniref:Uncharacterized protein n=1 Tax=Paenibacillus sp. BIHB 4019 TaxID=1870819 RepID=A0A1B2DM43_9BACL|nr:hypothetical protein [Paenibacillus sp. BIHB 4019]ANY68771.1 hypothetical protein BBD42_21595 [Paenibacillus sp. BIHB 4019]